MGGEFSNWSSHIGDLKYKKKLSIKEYVIKSKSKLIFLLMVIILGVIISSITPYLYGKIIDYIVNGDLKSIKNLLFCFATFNIVSIALSILENVIGTQITIGISNDIKYKIFSHILHLKAKEQDQYSTGELLNRTEGDADAVVSYYINVITSWIMIIINLTVSIYFLLKISKMLTGIGILLLPVNYLINFLFRNRIKIYKLKEKQKEDGYFKFVNIALSSLKNIKVLLLEKFFSHKFLEIKDEQYKIEIKNVYLSSLINFLQQFFNQIFEVIIIFISAVFIIKGILSIGMMVSFNSYLEKLFNAISRLISLNLEKQTLAISLERINDIQSKEKEIVNENQPIKINKIEFSHVSFKYDKNEVLRDICFTINENGLYSIVGENGSGKTTILKLIDKLYVISKGEIFINDINIDELELGKLRRSISYMMKDNLIMPTSLYENIILGCDRVPDNDYLEELCQMLQLNELKNRIGGLWGEINGDMLSSGEKQKVGLARALVNGSNLILLDEATSDMDGSVEKQVVNIIKNLSNNIIIINVCHRRELTFSSKEIYVLKDGMIVEVGSHEELIKKQGIYSSLFDSKAFI